MSESNNATIYRLMYWSTRKKGDILDPYGEEDYSDVGKYIKGKRKLEASKDIYRIETWKRTAFVEREKIVEDYHGNPAHLKLKNARRESDV